MIKFAFRWAFRFLVLAIVLVTGLVLLKDTLIKEVTQKRMQRETGLQVRIGSMQVGLLTPTISMQNLVIYNPAEFGGGPFLDIPDLHVEYDYAKLPQLKLLRLDVRELHIIENHEGETNLVTIIDKVAPEAFSRSRQGASGTNEFGGIEMLNLSVGKVRYTNFRHPKRNQELSIAIRNNIFQNIRTEQDIAGVFLKVLVRAGITVYFENSAVLKPGVRSKSRAAVH